PSGIKIGTLKRLAKLNGYVDGASPAAPPLSKADAALIAEERAKRERAAAERLEVNHGLAAQEAANKWGAAAVDGTSAYLATKQVAGHGVRYASGAVLVPM
ncbi:hypothetical protein FPK47_22880, partial [Acinetobacter baumannii]|nr:hypothetical protein [Acinetobacter baumannii]